MKLRLYKIVYGYALSLDKVSAMQHFRPCEEGEDADIFTSDEVDWAKKAEYYTGQEWENLLYSLKSHRPDVELVKAEDEAMKP